MKLTPVAVNTAVLVLTACSGGGDAPLQLTMQQSQTISGVTATDTALPGAAVDMTYSAGSGTATTRADGSYSAPIAGTSLPYVVMATSSDGRTVLHSLVAGLGSIDSTAAANIAPLMELLLAQLTGQGLAEYVAKFSSATTVNANDVTVAQAALIKVLQNTGFDASGIGDFLGGTLSVGSDQGYGGVLGTLQSKLAGVGVTLTDLSTTVASTGGSSSGSTGSMVGTVLAPANSACPALKSSDHRLIKFSDGSTQVVTIDAAKLTVAMGSSSYQLIQGATACGYTLDNTGSTRMLVAKSGVTVWTNGSGGAGVFSLSLPKQIVDLTAINRSYVYALLSEAGQGTFGTNNYAKGVVTTATSCVVNAPCAPDLDSPYGHMIATSDGGVDWVDGGASVGAVDTHAYGFRNAQGNTVFVVALTGGDVDIFAPQTTLSMPAVGMTNAFWQSNVKSAGLSAVTEDSNTIIAMDGSTMTRTFADTHTGQIIYNDPFAGLRHRPDIKVCANTSGVAVTCNEAWQLPLSDLTLALGGSPSVTPSTYQMNFSVNKPGN